MGGDCHTGRLLPRLLRRPAPNSVFWLRAVARRVLVGITTGRNIDSVYTDGRLAVEATMDVADVARSVLHMASLPPEANVQFMTVIATTMPFIGRG